MSRPPSPAPAPRGATALAALLLTVVAAFQAALAFGAPWGKAAYGGAHRGPLPVPYRTASTISSIAYAALALVTLGRGPGATTRRRVLTGSSALMAVGTVMNLASRSRLERLLWSPVAGVLAVTLLHVARRVPADQDGRR